MDVIALAQAGLGHAVAPLGTAVTERQLRAAVAAGRGADRLPRRRPRRPRRGPAGGRARAAADARRADAALRRAARRRGPGQLPAPARCRGAHGGVVQSAHSFANDLAAGDAGPPIRGARGARGAQPAAARSWPGSPAIPTCGASLLRSVPEPAAGAFEPRPQLDAAPAETARRPSLPAGKAWGPRGSRPASRGRRSAARRGCCSRVLRASRNGCRATRRSSASCSCADPRLELLRQEIVAWFVGGRQS